MSVVSFLFIVMLSVCDSHKQTNKQKHQWKISCQKKQMKIWGKKPRMINFDQPKKEHNHFWPKKLMKIICQFMDDSWSTKIFQQQKTKNKEKNIDIEIDIWILSKEKNIRIIRSIYVIFLFSFLFVTKVSGKFFLFSKI